ncbi:MAG: DUF3576 domain-containing protein [Caulobacterales bacterium]|nr:DUF3576 domain-containing protein [Caulobacterales bacterium]
MNIARGLLGVTLAVGLVSGLSACGTVSRVVGGGESQPEAPQVGIGVNGYLWRASLDTLSFLPLETADPWGGIINYGWHSTTASPNERIKATIYILDSRLRADALNVTVYRQVRNEAGDWVEAQVSPQTETDLENAILTRARQLRLAGTGD